MFHEVSNESHCVCFSPRSVGDLKFAHKQRQLAAELKERMHAS